MSVADEKIEECLRERKSFLVDAGAGSGKTYSLVAALNSIRKAHRPVLVKNSQKVACITFTNVAKDEIGERTEHDPLFEISTIHDFLWSVIKGYQSELKDALLAFNAVLPEKSRRRQKQDELATALLTIPSVTYSDRGANFLEGRIFHDDLLDIALIMFKSHAMLSKIVAARFPFIFVDEYQDTNPKVISILLDHVLACAKLPVIGFFGDKMQSIYTDVVGELRDDEKAKLQIIPKEENYRCSKAVIKVLNNIRSDIEQVPAGDNLDGSAVYINLASKAGAEDLLWEAKQSAVDQFGWKLEEDTKFLFLTHRLIARKAGYERLWTAYNERGGFSKDRFQSGEDDIAKFFCEKVEPLIFAWRDGKAGRAIAMLNAEGVVLASRANKERFKDALSKLVSVSEEKSIGEVLRHLRDNELIVLPDSLASRFDKDVRAKAESDEADTKFFNDLFAIPYVEVSAYRGVLEKNLPYSTKHGVKGDEFDTVFVVLDDAGANWNQYSFNNLLLGNEKIDARLRRTSNLFYVSCSRAKRNLAVVDLGSAQGKEELIRKMFGDSNVRF